MSNDHDGDGGYFIRVIDTGIGISEEDIPRIFERFGQVHNVEIRSIEGVGLGLPLTKTLVEMHNGTISIDSDVGIGTTVTVWFPSERIAQSA